jgi:hypothetical protein
MADYTWRPNGLPVKAQGIAVEPILAFKLFVLPAIGNPNWIEDSSKVTDTGMSKREWIGLIIHALALMELTGDSLRVAKMTDNDDGGLVRGENEAVYVEQTLATHKDARYQTLEQAVAGQVGHKSSRGQNYAENRHLIVLCNMDGNLDEDKLAAIVAKGQFNIVNIFGFNGKDRHYLSYIFDRDKPNPLIHKTAISEAVLVEAANELQAIPKR